VPGVAAETRFAELVRRVLGLRESTSLHPIEDLMPVLSVLDPGAPEQALLRRDKPFLAGFGSNPIVAQFGLLEIFNPLASGGIIVVDSFETGAPLGLLRMRWQNQVGQTAGLVNLVAVTAKTSDGRNRNDPFTRGFGVLRAGTVPASVALGGACTSFATNLFSTVTPVGIVLAPGQAFVLEAGTTNLELIANIRWRERALDASEMNPG
jgi:hypothetical protein